MMRWLGRVRGAGPDGADLGGALGPHAIVVGSLTILSAGSAAGSLALARLAGHGIRSPAVRTPPTRRSPVATGRGPSR